MERILYCLTYGVMKLMALMPLRVLYLISDCLFIIIYYVVRYRRSVVMRNLTESFPEKTSEDLKAISNQFYRNFADYIVETVKLLHISDKEMSSRFRFEGLESIEAALRKGKSVAVYYSHCGNWEWGTSVTLHMNFYEKGRNIDFCQVYRPLRNRVFDRLMLKLRSRFGSLSLPKTSVMRTLFYLKRDNLLTVTGFMSDQKPSHDDSVEITTFLNHPTAIIAGTERLARKLGMAAVYWDVYKPRRGHYIVKCLPMADDVAATEQGSVTLMYARLLEETIRRNPPIWLWTHKRWKNPVQLPPLQ